MGQPDCDAEQYNSAGNREDADVLTLVGQPEAHNASEAEHGPHRQIDPTRKDNHGLPQRQQPENRRVADHAVDSDRPEEIGIN